jgi:hypothetical protein
MARELTADRLLAALIDGRRRTAYQIAQELHADQPALISPRASSYDGALRRLVADGKVLSEKVGKGARAQRVYWREVQCVEYRCAQPATEKLRDGRTLLPFCFPCATRVKKGDTITVRIESGLIGYSGGVLRPA